MRFLRSAGFRLFAILLARFGLASTYLSAVADRFGAWTRLGATGPSADMQHFAARVQAIIPHAPSSVALGIAWAATLLDSAFGLGLLLGLRTRTMAFGSGILSLVYAIGMALSPGGLQAMFASALLAMAGASMLLAAVADDL
jgi:uncharacterized membrane protein YphA (DoxX/SURF4 family)